MALTSLSPNSCPWLMNCSCCVAFLIGSPAAPVSSLRSNGDLQQPPTPVPTLSQHQQCSIPQISILVGLQLCQGGSVGEALGFGASPRQAEHCLTARATGLWQHGTHHVGQSCAKRLCARIKCQSSEDTVRDAPGEAAVLWVL